MDWIGKKVFSSERSGDSDLAAIAMGRGDALCEEMAEISKPGVCGVDWEGGDDELGGFKKGETNLFRRMGLWIEGFVILVRFALLDFVVSIAFDFFGSASFSEESEELEDEGADAGDEDDELEVGDTVFFFFFLVWCFPSSESGLVFFFDLDFEDFFFSDSDSDSEEEEEEEEEEDGEDFSFFFFEIFGFDFFFLLFSL